MGALLGAACQSVGVHTKGWKWMSGSASCTGYVIGVIHAEDSAKAEAEIAELKALFPQARIEMSVFGPVIGTHLGPGAIGVTWYHAAE